MFLLCVIIFLVRSPETVCAAHTRVARNFILQTLSGSTGTSALLTFALQVSRSEGIGPLHRESSFPYLRRIRRRNTRKLGPHVIDNVEIAVRSIVISQAHISTHCLRVRSVYLNQACKRQKPGEGIISLHACQRHRKVSIGERQPKPVPGL